MRDRLIEFIGKELMDYASWQTEMALAGNYDMPSVEEVIADKILKDGWFIPPCKVGDTVWDTEGNTWKVFAITIWQDCISLKTANSKHVRKTFAIGKRSIGKTVFFAEEEVEQALKGGVQE